MNPISQIRARLGITQSTMAAGIGVSQGNVSNYEHGQSMPPEVANRLIAYAHTLGHAITFNDVYGSVPASPAGAVEVSDRPRRSLAYGKNVLTISIDQRPIDDVKN